MRDHLKTFFKVNFFFVDYERLAYYQTLKKILYWKKKYILLKTGFMIKFFERLPINIKYYSVRTCNIFIYYLIVTQTSLQMFRLWF